MGFGLSWGFVVPFSCVIFVVLLIGLCFVFGVAVCLVLLCLVFLFGVCFVLVAALFSLVCLYFGVVVVGFLWVAGFWFLFGCLLFRWGFGVGFRFWGVLARCCWCRLLLYIYLHAYFV